MIVPECIGQRISDRGETVFPSVGSATFALGDKKGTPKFIFRTNLEKSRV
jgi:hypothetical protein